MTTPRIFISYKRGVSPDEPVALEAFNQLRKHFHVFIDQTMMVGTLWAEQIEKEIRQADFLISFLSEHSVASEMVLGEIKPRTDCAESISVQSSCLCVWLTVNHSNIR